MISTPRSLHAFFQARAAAAEPLVLATVVATEGSTYRKPGAQMLIAGDGSTMGLLSGGCLETDLGERARRVLMTSTAEIVTYDARTSNDPIWGLGLGCEGAMRILLTRLDPESGYLPFAFVAERIATHAAGATAFVLETNDRRFPLGHGWHSGMKAASPAEATIVARCEVRAIEGGFETLDVNANGLGLEIFICALDLPARLLLLGAGADAAPVVEIASLLGWQVTIGDHRPAYLDPQRFAEGVRLIELNPRGPRIELPPGQFDAAVVMSHHLEADARYLRALAESAVPYIGLLGPAARRRRLLADLGEDSTRLGNRLYGPVGLDIGARTPETIAVAIIAEIQAFLAGRPGEPFRIGAGQ
ncbi:MAG TPA: XdhC family protein [Steroidobacteraceae bacterium]|nr:XdhC family protein [Steroidobacteraceae bacterium]